MTEVDVSPPFLLPPLLAGVVSQANVTVGWTTVLLVLYGVLHFTGCALPKKYPLSEREKGEWNVRIASTLNAVVCSVGRSTLVYRLCGKPLRNSELILGYIPDDRSEPERTQVI